MPRWVDARSVEELVSGGSEGGRCWRDGRWGVDTDGVGGGLTANTDGV